MALGRGLSSLISATPVPVSFENKETEKAEKIIEMPIRGDLKIAEAIESLDGVRYLPIEKLVIIQCNLDKNLRRERSMSSPHL